MLTTTQITRTAATTALIATLGTTSIAVARPDAPLRPAIPTSGAHFTQHWTTPRTEGPGVEPLDHDTDPASTPPVATTRVEAGAAAVPLTRGDDASDTDWLPFAGAGALGLLVVLAFAAARNHRPLSHPFRTPRL
jgi:hypothetical protein